jgi:hypothetical protein
VVKRREIVNLAGRFEAEAQRILRQIPGLTVTPERGGADRGVDFILTSAGGKMPIAVQLKHRVNAATAWQLVRQAETEPNLPMLLIAGETTSEAREILEEHGVAVIDGLGNAHIELPGLLFHIAGRPGRPRARPARLTGKAGLVAQAMLREPGRDWQVQDLAEAAGVSVGLAHRVLARVEEEGVVSAEGGGHDRVRRVTNPAALLDLWAEENVDRPLRTLAHVLARTPKQLLNELGGNLTRGHVDYALTGAAGGSLVAPFITAVPVAELWVPAGASPEQLYAASGADPVTDGQNVVFLQGRDDSPLAFREQIDDLWVANRFRLYVDLRRDPRRGREQADHLRREVIGF